MVGLALICLALGACGPGGSSAPTVKVSATAASQRETAIAGHLLAQQAAGLTAVAVVYAASTALAIPATAVKPQGLGGLFRTATAIARATARAAAAAPTLTAAAQATARARPKRRPTPRPRATAPRPRATALGRRRTPVPRPTATPTPKPPKHHKPKVNPQATARARATARAGARIQATAQARATAQAVAQSTAQAREQYRALASSVVSLLSDASARLKQAETYVDPTQPDFNPSLLSRAKVYLSAASSDISQSRIKLAGAVPPPRFAATQQTLNGAIASYATALTQTRGALKALQNGNRDAAVANIAAAGDALKAADALLQQAASALSR